MFSLPPLVGGGKGGFAPPRRSKIGLPPLARRARGGKGSGGEGAEGWEGKGRGGGARWCRRAREARELRGRRAAAKILDLGVILGRFPYVKMRFRGLKLPKFSACGGLK